MLRALNLFRWYILRRDAIHRRFSMRPSSYYYVHSEWEVILTASYFLILLGRLVPLIEFKNSQ